MKAAEQIRRIAKTVEGWDDGWEAQFLPEQDDWVRLTLDPAFSHPTLIELDIAYDAGEWYLMAGCRTKVGTNPRWIAVSTSIRKPEIRKAIDYINAELDRTAVHD